MTMLKRTLALLLTLVLVFAMVPAASAAVISEDDTYVLQRKGGTSSYTGPTMQYSSPYSADFTYNADPGRVFPSLYTMYNSRSGDVIPTYCTDIKVAAREGTIYRRMNLEESHFSNSSAGLIRAIVNNGFYIVPKDNESAADHEARVTAKLKALGEAAGVENLTLGEALSGTQLAIWQAAHGSILSYVTMARNYPGKASTAAVKYASLCNAELNNLSFNGSYLTDESTAHVNAQIRAVYNYLLKLTPEKPTGKLVSPASFTSLSDPVFTANENGTFDVSVTTSVNVDMASGDTLTLKASLGSQSATKALHDGKQTITLTLSDVPAEQFGRDVTLAISGYQTASDVFLFDAMGDREASQAMVAKDNSQLPVYASVRATTSRILKFYKTTKNTGTSQPLEGIVFDIFPIATLEDYLSGKFDLPEPEDCPHPNLAEYSVITDKNGEASFNLTQFGLPDGIYLVVERNHPAIKAPVKPFYVTFPMTSASGTGYEYEVTVRPKNEVKGGVEVDKDILARDPDKASVDAYAPHTWVISGTVPEDIAGGKSYVITDTLDNRLDYLGNLKVNLETADGDTVVTLTAADDYSLTVTDVNSLGDGKPSDAFKLALTGVGMGKIAAEIGTNDFDDYRVCVYFDAQINANAQMGESIPNQADLTYTNSVNITFSDKSDKPVVYTGAANLLKVDANDLTQVLSGATFEVYRTATAEEVAAGENLVYLDDVAGAVIKVSFFDNAALEGEKVSSVTSDQNGQMAVYGLAYGTYYLVETQAPAGYNLMGDTVELPIDGTSHTEEKVVILENRAGTVLPETGGIGTTVFTASGILLIAFCILLILSKKRNATH